MTWIQTHSGVAFDLLEPKPEMVRLEDIAHALSRINRFSGHTLGEPYSVAHHSMLVADLLASWGAPPAVVREGLLHDAPESGYGDTVSPVQRCARVMIESKLVDLMGRGVIAWGPHGYLGELDGIARLARELDPLRQIRERVDPVFRKALGLEHETPIVKRADLVALAIERRDLMVVCDRDWELPEYAPMTPRIVGVALSRWTEARNEFTVRLRDLDAKIAGHS